MKVRKYDKAKARAYYQKNRQKILEQNTRGGWLAKLRNLYGLTELDYARMLVAQDGKCAICGADKPGGRFKHFLVDHNHVSRQVRGLLCDKCNRGLGYFRDNPEFLKAAVVYLAKLEI